MRVLMVSALFPLTVLTGGTQVPWLQAHALRALGHDVHLFGGHIDRGPTARVRRTVVGGFPATLVDVAGRLDPDDPGFFRNATANAEFAALLATGFDVVHLHSVQGLGADLVGWAGRSGACTVVQMHDFFWTCDRQFLVKETQQPCTGLPQPGCRCTDSRIRSRILAEADCLLVPTSEMGTWISNLGLDVSRVRVLGWPAPSLPTPAPTTAWDLTAPYVLYLGGPSTEKGWSTLQLAAWGDDSRSTRVLCPGVPPAAVPGELAPMLVCGPKATREEVSLLMRQANAVVVPSVAAETFSYVAREALSVGTPVIITDGPGGVDCWRSCPDLVHLVPRGRPDYLRSAMLRALAEPRADTPTCPPAAVPDLGRDLVDLYESLKKGPS